jgi:hypothetical protein
VYAWRENFIRIPGIINKAIKMNRQEWELNHAACPKCGNANTKQTLVGVIEFDGKYEDDINTAQCPACGWSGLVKELVPEDMAGQQQKPMPVRTLDFQGESYVSTKDVVVAMLDFNKRLKETVHREDVQKFADAIFGELTQMIVTVDKQHWVNKYNYQAKMGEEMAKKAKEELDGGAPTNDKQEE